MSGYPHFHDPFFDGVTAVLPASAVTPWDVVINGRGYLLDLEHAQAPYYAMKSIPMLTSMFLQDRGTVPIGEHSLNPHDYWRRSVDDWSAGAGQENLDHHDSVPNRFRTSKGIDCWTAGQISLLPSASKVAIYTESLCVAVGERLYVVGDDQFRWTTDLATFTGVSPDDNDDALDGTVGITSDGFSVWVADGTRVHYTTRRRSTYAPFHTTDHSCQLIRAAKSRLFTARGTRLFTHTMTAGRAVATEYFTHFNPDWEWTDIAGGPDSVYFSGFSGNVSQIYSATIKTDGSALDAPVVVVTLPTGEIVRSMREYLGILVIGTDKGLRIAEIGGQAGQLVLGQRVDLPYPPLCFEPQDRFVWFGWTNYDEASTGLGRIDLSVFNAPTTGGLGTPGYATDLMADGKGTITSVATLNDRRVFTVEGSGLWSQDTTYVTAGEVTSGALNYELADPKVAIKLLAQYRKGAGFVAASVTADDRNPTPLQTVATSPISAGSTTMDVPHLVANTYEVTFDLSTPTTTSAATGSGVFAAAVLADSPYIWWDTRLASGVAQADRSGNGRTGTISGSPSLDPALGATFVRNADWITSDDTFTFTATTWSFETVISATPWASEVRSAFVLDDPPDENQTSGLIFQPNGAVPAGGAPFLYYVTSANETSTAVGTSAFHHVVGEWDGASVKVYIDGVLATITAPTTTAALTAAGVHAILANDGFFTEGFDGIIRHGMFYDHSLGAARVAAHYAALADDPAPGASTTVATRTPVIDRFTLMVEPQPERRFNFTVPLRMHHSEQTRLGSTVTYSPALERARFINLCESREVVVFQDFEATYRALIDDVEWIPYAQVGNTRTWDGCLVLQVKLVN